MTSTAGYRVVVAAAVVLVASSAAGEAGSAGTVDSGISGVVIPGGCKHLRPCQRAAPRAFVQVARPDSGVVVTVRARNFRFHVTLRPGTYLLRLVRTANTVGTGGRVVTVRPHAFTIVVLRT